MNIKRVYQLVLASSRIPAFSFALPLLEWVSPLAQKNTNNNNFISLLKVNLSRSILWKRRYSFLRSYRLQITAEMDFEISRRNKTFCKMSLNMLKICLRISLFCFQSQMEELSQQSSFYFVYI